MDGWMDGWTGGRTDRQTDRQTVIYFFVFTEFKKDKLNNNIVCVYVFHIHIMA